MAASPKWLGVDCTSASITRAMAMVWVAWAEGKEPWLGVTISGVIRTSSSAGRRQSPALSPENARAAEALVANAGRVHATTALLARGQERFDIFCSPCHSVAGDGDGMVVRRGFPSPPSFDIDRLRKAPDAYFYDVITHGHGAMYPYAERVPPEDRLAIIAYIRALQLAMRAPVAVVPEAERTKLEASR